MDNEFVACLVREVYYMCHPHLTRAEVDDYIVFLDEQRYGEEMRGAYEYYISGLRTETPNDYAGNYRIDDFC